MAWYRRSLPGLLKKTPLRLQENGLRKQTCSSTLGTRKCWSDKGKTSAKRWEGCVADSPVLSSMSLGERSLKYEMVVRADLGPLLLRLLPSLLENLCLDGICRSTGSFLAICFRHVPLSPLAFKEGSNRPYSIDAHSPSYVFKRMLSVAAFHPSPRSSVSLSTQGRSQSCTLPRYVIRYKNLLLCVLCTWGTLVGKLVDSLRRKPCVEDWPRCEGEGGGGRRSMPSACEKI